MNKSIIIPQLLTDSYESVNSRTACNFFF